MIDPHIEIPELNLYASVEEGTNEESLNRPVSHYECILKQGGRCGLVAKNYFSKISNLKVGDKIYYFINGEKYEYEVVDTYVNWNNWSTLKENTQENGITLMTPIETDENYALYVQGLLK